MKKILFLIPNLSHGGAEKVLVNLVNNMDKNKFDVTVQTLFDVGENKQFLSNDIKYKSCFKKSFRGNSKVLKLFTPKSLYKHFIKEHYDIIVSYLEGPTARIVSGCTDNDTKLVSWIHVEQHSRSKASRSFRSYSEALACYERFNKTICVSNYVMQDFLSIFPTIKNTEVLYNTNETEQIVLQKDEPVEDGLFRQDEIKICGVGKIIPTKGFDKLARIHCRLRNEGFPLHTYILGVGDQKDSIMEYITQNEQTDSFTFLGYNTNPYKFVGRCDVFVCASIAEGFSTAATEALIVGTPVVTTLVSGMEEMLGKNNEYGIITENNEEALYQGLKRMISEKGLLEHYTNKAIERSAIFSRKRTVEAVENMLLSL